MTYNRRAVSAATEVAHAALDDLLSGARRRHAVVIPAVAGAGKSSLVRDATGRARALGLRAAVCAPTNSQCFGLVNLLASHYPDETVTFVPAQHVELPPAVAVHSNVVQVQRARHAQGSGLIVGTFDKLGDAFARGDLSGFDVLLGDESYQADAAKYFGVAGLAPTHFLVGDSGQIDPFSTADDADRWRGLPEDPLQTAVGVLLRNHPETPVYPLPITHRLDQRAVRVAEAFYPGHEFEAAVLPDVRQLRLMPTVVADHHTRVLDAALELAARTGWAHVELTDAAVLTADPETMALIVGLLRRLLQRGPETRCERQRDWTPLVASRIAVGVSHNDQKDHLRSALDAAGLRAVVVDTANKLQGAEFDLVVAWHPLAGLPDADGFHLAPGRACVLLTRHRHACIVVGRAGDRALLDGLPPSTPAYLGWDPDPVLDGWGTHQTVFERLEPYRLTA